jgi:hypothetical protein
MDEQRNKAMSVGGEAFAESLKNYGPTAVLDHLVRISSTHADWVIDELLAIFPTVVATAEFIHRCKETWEIDAAVALKKIKDDPDWLRKQGVL